jgi:acyl CoA:acetate/3-ketoacid CoA transferase beta subunit
VHRDRHGGPKLVERCRLPLTARGRVTTIVTELAVLEPAGDRFRLRELAPGVTLDEVRAATGAPLDASEVRPWSSVAGDGAAGIDDA